MGGFELYLYSTNAENMAVYQDLGIGMRTYVYYLDNSHGVPSYLHLVDSAGVATAHEYYVDTYDTNVQAFVLTESQGDKTADFMSPSVTYVGIPSNTPMTASIMFYDYVDNAIWFYPVEPSMNQDMIGWQPENSVEISQYVTTLDLAPSSLPQGTAQIAKQGSPTMYDVDSIHTTNVWLSPDHGDLTGVFAPLDYIEFGTSIPTSITGVYVIDAVGGIITFTENIVVESTGDLTLNVASLSDLHGGTIITVRPGGKIKLMNGLQIIPLTGTLYFLKVGA